MVDVLRENDPLLAVLGVCVLYKSVAKVPVDIDLAVIDDVEISNWA